jgi:uncharacterized protein (TIGR00297 family)
MVTWTSAVAASLLASALAWRAGALSPDGAAAAVVVGTVVAGGGGWSWAALLVLFVAAASLASALPPQPQAPRRSARQVLANGGVACLAAAAGGLHLSAAAPVFAAAVAAAWADTWATEFGTRYGGRPRRLWGLGLVEPGASGGVTALGTAAGLVAAGCCGVAAAALAVAPAALTAAAGAAGMLVDSLLGATVQEEFRCPGCGRVGETPRCVCGAQARRVRGVPGWGGGWTNFVATAAAASVGLGWTLLASVP